MKIEITTVWHVKAYPQHHREDASDEDVVASEISSLESALWHGGAFEWAEIVSATGRVIEP